MCSTNQFQHNWYWLHCFALTINFQWVDIIFIQNLEQYLILILSIMYRARNSEFPQLLFIVWYGYHYLDGKLMSFIHVFLVQVFVTIYVLLLFQDPLPSSRPPVTGYYIYHHTTGSLKFIWTNETMFTFDDVASGSYIFVIVAVNTIGEGEQNYCLISGYGSTNF